MLFGLEDQQAAATSEFISTCRNVKTQAGGLFPTTPGQPPHIQLDAPRIPRQGHTPRAYGSYRTYRDAPMSAPDCGVAVHSADRSRDSYMSNSRRDRRHCGPDSLLLLLQKTRTVPIIPYMSSRISDIEDYDRGPSSIRLQSAICR
jgi:hypothetical protein